MKQYKIFIERTVIETTIIEADSATEAEEYAEENFTDCEWNYLDGSDSTEILIGETEEL